MAGLLSFSVNSSDHLQNVLRHQGSDCSVSGSGPIQRLYVYLTMRQHESQYFYLSNSEGHCPWEGPVYLSCKPSFKSAAVGYAVVSSFAFKLRGSSSTSAVDVTENRWQPVIGWRQCHSAFKVGKISQQPHSRGWHNGRKDLNWVRSWNSGNVRKLTVVHVGQRQGCGEESRFSEHVLKNWTLIFLDWKEGGENNLVKFQMSSTQCCWKASASILEGDPRRSNLP